MININFHLNHFPYVVIFQNPGAIPPPPMDYIFLITEGGDNLITEGGDQYIIDT